MSQNPTEQHDDHHDHTGHGHHHVHGPGCNHHHHHDHGIQTFVRQAPKTQRNDPCPCGSGKKYKKCCLKG